MVALLEMAPVVHEKDSKNLEVGPTWDGDSSRRLWLSACYDVPGAKTTASSGRLPLTRSHSSTDRKDGGGTYGVHVREKAGDVWSKNGVRITRDGFVQLMKMMPDLVDRCLGSAGMTEDEARYVRRPRFFCRSLSRGFFRQLSSRNPRALRAVQKRKGFLFETRPSDLGAFYDWKTIARIHLPR